MVYTPIPISNGSVEIEGLQYIFSSGTAIIEAPVTSDPFYHPGTAKVTTLMGQTQYEPITLRGLLSDTQVNALEALIASPKSKSGELTATHTIGTLQTILTGVRIGRYERGEFDKLSNNASHVTIEFTFDGTRRI